MKAIVLITAKVGSLHSVMESLADHGFDVATLAGVYDLVAFVEATDEHHLGSLVFDRLQATPGVLNTVTLIQLDYAKGRTS